MSRARLSVVVAAVAACAAVSLPAQDAYGIRRLTCPGLAHGVAWKIDADGAIVGEMLDRHGRSQPVRWQLGRGERLPTPTRLGGAAYASDGRGTVVGLVRGATGERAAAWVSGGGGGLRHVDLGALAGSFGSMALAAGHGLAVGFVDDGVQAAPALWRAVETAPQHVALPLPPWAIAGEAVALLDARTAVGFVADFGTARPVTWDLSGPAPAVTQLPTGGAWGRVAAANRDGVAVGAVWSAARARVHLATWSGGALRDHGGLDGADCFGQDVNRDGDVVGYARTSGSAAYVGVLARGDRGVVDLNELLPAGTGWTIVRALGIADDGTIVGAGILDGFYEPFVMAPK